MIYKQCLSYKPSFAKLMKATIATLIMIDTDLQKKAQISLFFNSNSFHDKAKQRKLKQRSVITWTLRGPMLGTASLIRALWTQNCF